MWCYLQQKKVDSGINNFVTLFKADHENMEAIHTRSL